MTKIKQFVFNHFEENTYIVWDDTKLCAIIDPGMNSHAENSKLAQFITDNNLIPTKVILTHAHIDHIAGLRFVCETYNLPITAHCDSTSFLKQAESYGSMMGFDTTNMDDINIECVNDNDVINIGDTVLKCLYVPGHAAGSMAYTIENINVVFTGDVLFRQSIGRTDLPTGDYDMLMKMLKTKILTLNDECEVLPGHGPSSSIGDEKNMNPFLIQLY